MTKFGVNVNIVEAIVFANMEKANIPVKNVMVDTFVNMTDYVTNVRIVRDAIFANMTEFTTLARIVKKSKHKPACKTIQTLQSLSQRGHMSWITRKTLQSLSQRGHMSLIFKIGMTTPICFSNRCRLLIVYWKTKHSLSRAPHLLSEMHILIYYQSAPQPHWMGGVKTVLRGTCQHPAHTNDNVNMVYHGTIA